MSTHDPLLTIAEAASELGLSVRHTRALVADELIRSIDVSAVGAKRRHRRVPRSALHEFRVARCNEPEGFEGADDLPPAAASRHPAKRVFVLSDDGAELAVEVAHDGRVFIHSRHDSKARTLELPDRRDGLRLAGRLMLALVE